MTETLLEEIKEDGKRAEEALERRHQENSVSYSVKEFLIFWTS